MFLNHSETNRLTSFVQSPLFFSAVIVVITLLTFIHVLSADFVMWDDDRMIYDNPNLKGLSLERLHHLFTEVDVTRRYTPLAGLNYTITYHFCKLNPFGYHFSAWLFHAANAVLLFRILRNLLLLGFSPIKAKGLRLTIPAAIGALLWSLHPLRVEPTAWAGANFYPQACFLSAFVAVVLSARQPGRYKPGITTPTFSPFGRFLCIISAFPSNRDGLFCGLYHFGCLSVQKN